MRGAESGYVTADAEGAIDALFPGARLVRVPGVGHLVPQERPDTVAAAVAGLAGGGPG